MIDAESVVGVLVVPVVRHDDLVGRRAEGGEGAPTLKVILPPASGVAPPVAETKVTSSGMVSVRTTPVASDRPLFVAVIV